MTISCSDIEYGLVPSGPRNTGNEADRKVSLGLTSAFLKVTWGQFPFWTPPILLPFVKYAEGLRGCAIKKGPHPALPNLDPQCHPPGSPFNPYLSREVLNFHHRRYPPASEDLLLIRGPRHPIRSCALRFVGSGAVQAELERYCQDSWPPRGSCGVITLQSRFPADYCGSAGSLNLMPS